MLCNLNIGVLDPLFPEAPYLPVPKSLYWKVWTNILSTAFQESTYFYCVYSTQ